MALADHIHVVLYHLGLMKIPYSAFCAFSIQHVFPGQETFARRRGQQERESNTKTYITYSDCATTCLNRSSDVITREGPLVVVSSSFLQKSKFINIFLSQIIS